jgi:hypothetical protein
MVRDTNHVHHFEDGVCSCMVLVMRVVCLVNLLNQIHFLCSMSSDGITEPLLKTTTRCGSTGKMTMEPPHSLDFQSLSFVALRFGASFVLCIEVFWKQCGI